MPTARKVKTPSPSSPVSEGGRTVKLPDFKLDANFTPLLIVLLLIASFFLGSLVTRVQLLENGTSGNPAEQLAAAPQPAGDPAAQAPTGDLDPVSDSDHIRGNKDAKVMLVEYSDFECPFCKQFHPTLQEVMDTYGDDVAWVYRHYPLDFHQNALKEAEASECVAELAGEDAFWEFADKIFERTTSNGTGFALDKLGPLAAEVGADQAAFQSCLDSGKYTQKVKDQMAKGTSAGVTGTPATFVVAEGKDPQIISGAQAIDSVKTLVDQALAD